MLDLLPLEILYLVFSYVRTSGALPFLCLVSKALNSAASPLLYEHVTIFVGEDWLDLRKLKDFPWPTSPSLKFTKELTIESPFEGANFHQIINKRRGKNEAKKAISSELLEVEEPLLRLLERLEEGNLRAFRWHLGLPLPYRLFNTYLFKHQRSLRSFSLITDGSRSPTASYRFVPVEATFSNLRCFAWRGIYRPTTFPALESLLLSNASSLESLTIHPFLEVVSFDDINFWRFTQGIFANTARPEHLTDQVDPSMRWSVPFSALEAAWLPGQLQQYDQTSILPLLRNLSLCEMSLARCIPSLLRICNFSTLNKLQLWNCKDGEGLVKALVAISKSEPLKLTTLEFVGSTECGSIGHGRRGQPSILASLLHSFEGLRELYLLLGSHINWDSVFAAVLANHISLKALVISCFGLTSNDYVPLERGRYLGGITAEVHMLPSLEALSVSFLEVPYLRERLSGVSPDPSEEIRDYQREVTESTRRAEGIELLHLRLDAPWKSPLVRFHRCKEDLLSKNLHPRPLEGGLERGLVEFAQWAFGREGLPQLKVLAYGNFKRPRKADPGPVLLCRAENASTAATTSSSSSSSLAPENWSFRRVTEGETALQDLVKKHMDTLLACQPDCPILYTTENVL